MKTAIIATIAAAAALGLATGASAHHSAVQFDFGKQAQYKGVVKTFEAINPHMRMTLMVSGAKGPHEVEFEGHSTNNMYRNGYRKGMVSVGDTVTVNVAPMKNGTDGGFVVSAVTKDGKFFGAKSTRALDAAAAQKAAEGKQ